MKPFTRCAVHAHIATGDQGQIQLLRQVPALPKAPYFIIAKKAAATNPDAILTKPCQLLPRPHFMVRVAGQPNDETTLEMKMTSRNRVVYSPLGLRRRDRLIKPDSSA